MTLLQMLNEVSGRAEKKLDQTVENGESLKTVLLRGFNLYNQDFNNRFLWPWRWKYYPIQTIPNYKAGTVTVTNGSRSVTGTGFTSAMKGRFLKLTREDEIYQILSVTSAAALTLSTPYIGDSGAGLSFLIWKKFYDLPPEVPYLKKIKLLRWPHSVECIERSDIDDGFRRGFETGFPEAWALGEVNREVQEYSLGTVSAAQNSRTWTGVGTAWLDNASPGAELVIGTTVYNVESVDSDTQITTIQRASVVPPGTPHILRTRNRTQIMFSSVPDPAVNLYLRYPAKQYDLMNDLDESPVWEGYEHIVLDCLYGYILEKFTHEQGAYQWLKIYRQECGEAWASIQEMNPVDYVSRPAMNGGMRGYRRTLYG